MSQNHVLEEDGNSEEEEGRISSLRTKELEVFVIRIIDRRIRQVIEQNVISRIVQQELESAGELLRARLNHHSGIGVQSSESRVLQLKFLDKLSLPVLTNQMIKGEGSTPFRVALVDVTTEQVVTEASAKVEIVVVEGDFNCDNWTVEEFNKKIVRGKEGKKCLLTGNVHLNLEAGVGFIRDISFMHNSRWMKACKLRLGAKVVDNFCGARVREAVTEPFVLKDFRNTYAKKHIAPALTDEVWRLKKVGKDGPLHKRLVRENIKTVKDFLTRFFMDPQSLRNILGTAKMWEAIVYQARKCVLDKRLHLYFPIDSKKQYGVVFNVVGQVMGLISECRYVPVDKLSEDQKADANKLVAYALEHMKEVKSFDDETCMLSHLQLSNDAYPSNSPRLQSPSLCYSEPLHTHHGHGHTQPSTSSQYNQVIPVQLPVDANPSNIPSTDFPGIWSSFPSFGNESHLNEDGWQSMAVQDFVNGGPWFSPEDLLNPAICYTGSTSLQVVDMGNSFQYQYSCPEALDDMSSNVDDWFPSRPNFARIRWSRLSIVLRSMSKIGAWKVVSSAAVHASKRPRIYGSVENL